MSTAMDVGRKIVELVNQNRSMEAVDTLYAENVVSVEAGAPPGMPAQLEGLAAVRGKSQWWHANHDVHSMSAGGPWPHGDRFIATFKLDVTPKAGPMAGRRFQMEEAGLYTVEGGKVVREEFFYARG